MKKHQQQQQLGYTEYEQHTRLMALCPGLPG